MKILTITYGYPPYHKGGYEIRCRDVMEKLKQKGHEVVVITTRYPSNGKAIKTNELGIFRVMHHKFEPQSLLERIIHDIRDVRFLKRKIKEFKPDIIYLWQIATLSNMIIPFCAKLDIPLFHDVADVGLIYDAKVQKQGLYFVHQADDSKIKNQLRELAYKVIRFISGNLLQPHWDWPEEMRINFNSKNIKQDALEAGIPVEDSKVIYAGIDTQKFSFKERVALSNPIQIIIPSRIVPLKGTRDSILLVKYLKEKGLTVKLILAGGIGDQLYYDEMQQLIKRSGLEGVVEYPGMVSQEELAEIYRQADICFFPSYWKSGLSAVPLEAMACGCVVISYGNENSTEVIEDGHTGFIVPEGDFELAANIIQRMINNSTTYQEIISNARREIDSKYTMDRYVDDIEAFLIENIKIMQ